MRFIGATIYACIGMMAVEARSSSTQASSLRIMTYNVRYDSMPDDITVNQTIASLPKSIPEQPSHYYADTSEKPWSTRRIHIANDILSRDVDIYGGQELLNRQMLDLAELLGNKFGWIGVGRDDGKSRGEYSAIFYNKGTLQLGDWDTFWLTQTPFEPSKYPDAGSYRSATTAHFVSTDGFFTVINTHLDEQSVGQRCLGASLILHRAKYEAIKSRRPVFVTGDFNSPSSDGAYQILTGIREPERLNKTFTDKYSWSAKEGRDFKDFVFKDLLGEAPPWRRSGNYATFTDFAPLGDFENFKRLDYVFGSSNGGWTADAYHVGDNLYDDGVYASDHRPVYADVTIEKDGKLVVQQ